MFENQNVEANWNQSKPYSLNWIKHALIFVLEKTLYV